MVADGVNVLPAGAAEAWLRRHAGKLLELGPEPPTPAMLAARRYEITTLLEDLVDGRAPDELLATAMKLYDALAHLALRAASAWTGTGKHLARRLRAVAPVLADDLVAAMAAIIPQPEDGKRRFTTAVDRMLAPHGGPLLEGYRLAAPAEWRSAGVAFAEDEAAGRTRRTAE
ncbi:hypothetical protein IP91_02947 [Pseudoduganella lurida]|uniref:Uncharacterized protein n=2 Tax=Pseudoduganella lurida TaxID=1036180 RepID=A0A562R553_9BURK|nr:hypothetical protein IP91_02947 [Pseudoduganella lurida]